MNQHEQESQDIDITEFVEFRDLARLYVQLERVRTTLTTGALMMFAALAIFFGAGYVEEIIPSVDQLVDIIQTLSILSIALSLGLIAWSGIQWRRLPYVEGSYIRAVEDKLAKAKVHLSADQISSQAHVLAHELARTRAKHK